MLLELRHRATGAGDVRTTRELIVPFRFRGPPTSANGGYISGLLADAIDGPARVRLMAPPPLDTPLQLVHDHSRCTLHRGEQLLGEATADDFDLDVPPPPTAPELAAAAEDVNQFRPSDQVYPGCFVCGTTRAREDGLRIHSGAVRDREMVAAPWLPDRTLLGDDRRVRPEFVWAALDCPGYFAAPCAGRFALLGSLAVRIDSRPQLDEPCIITGWTIASEGRKHHVGTALFGADGVRHAIGLGTWVEPRAKGAQ